MMKTQFTDFGTLVRLRDPADAPRKKQAQLPESPKKPKTKKRNRRKPILSRLRNR